MAKEMESNIQKNEVKLPLQFTGAKYKYSCRLDKPVVTKDDYIEELEMRFEESVDNWNITCKEIYGGKGYIVQLIKLKNDIRHLETENKLMKKYIDKAQRMTNKNLKELL